MSKDNRSGYQITDIGTDICYRNIRLSDIQGILQMKPFKCILQRDSTETLLKLTGSMNESVQLPPSQEIGPEGLVVDFDGVDSINSVGIKHWVVWVGEVLRTSPQIRIAFRNCTKNIMDQVNGLKGFCPPQAFIESFYVPFYDENSEEVQYVLFANGREYDMDAEDPLASIKIPEVRSEQTNRLLELDVIPTRYFSFLRR